MTDLKKIVMTKDQVVRYIDKTDILKKSLERVPSIYIEGAASSGKTTAVRMLVSADRPDSCFWYDFSAEKEETQKKALEQAAAGRFSIIVFDRLDLCNDGFFFKNLERLIRSADGKKIILISREKPDRNLVRLLWEDKMKIIPQEFLFFTLDDIRDLGRKREVFTNPKEFLEETGGWPGCVSLCMSMLAGLQESGRENSNRGGSDSVSRAHPVRSRDLHRIRHRYEIESFIDGELLGSLTEEERGIVQCAVACSWISADMCESCLDIKDAEDLLEDLRRKGFLRKTGGDRYRVVSLFKVQNPRAEQPWKTYSRWYESHGCFKEAYVCLCRYVFGRSKNYSSSDSYDSGEDKKKAELDAFLSEHYDCIPFWGEDYSFVLENKRNEFPMIYLRGMCRRQKQDFEGLQKEIKLASRLKGHEGQEVYINLLYADTSISAREFTDHCNRIYSSGKGKKYRLFSAAGNLFNSLCGMKDLSSLFACKKKEVGTYAVIWENVFGQAEQQIYSMAGLDYYIETNRISKEDGEMLRVLDEEIPWRDDSAQVLLYRLLLLCKVQKKIKTEYYSERILDIKEQLYEIGDDTAADLGEAIYSVYSAGHNHLDLTAEWVRRHDALATEKINEENYYLIFLMLKSLIFLGGFDKAAGLALRLAKYFAVFKRHKLLSEVLFIQAIIRFQMRERGAALRYTIESFAEGGAFRYVRYYTDYGNTGKLVLDQFVEWHEAQNPDKWTRKRKYDYRSVLNMPESDYLQVVARAAGREERLYSKKQLHETERLTVTEMVVMQNLSRGLTNEQIAKELNLKITTVKSHLYSIYKKLGVKNRMEAIVRAGEIQML